MTDEHRDSQDAAPQTEAASGTFVAPGVAPSGVTPSGGAPSSVTPSGSSAPPVVADVSAPLASEGEGIDPFDYAETIVRDLAQHVGGRLRDLRQDLVSLHGAVVGLPESMRFGPLVASVQELRERVAHLTGVVTHQGARPAEEIERIGRGVGELTRSLGDLHHRLATVEQWLSAARASGGVNLPDLPPGPSIDALDKLAHDMHESLLRVVNAVRQAQLDLRDLRDEVRTGQPVGSGGDLAARVKALEEKLRQPTAATALSDATAGLAGLLFGAWPRLAQTGGADPLSKAVTEVLGGFVHVLGATVQLPAVPQNSGLVAVASGRHRGTPMILLVAVEDLKGQRWTVDATTGDLLPGGDQPPRQSAWRALIAAAALAERAQPGTVAVPVLIYGNGLISQAPSRQVLLAHGTEMKAPGPARRLTLVSAADLSMAGLVPADEAAANLTDLLLID